MFRIQLLLCICLFLAVPAAGQADAPATKPKLIVGGDHDCPPYEFLENGKATGFDIELMRAVADVMGFEVEFRLGRWAEVRQGLEGGDIDALAGMFFSAERNRQIDYTVPHTMVTSGIFVRRDSSIRSYADIQGKEIIVQEGDIIHESMDRSGVASHIVPVAEVGQALKLLAAGRHDGALLPSRLQGEHFVKTLGLGNIRTVRAELPPLPYCFAVRKGNQELLAKLDEGLNILKANGRYRDIYEKWFGVYERMTLWETVKTYVFFASAIIAALGAAGIAWSRSLRRQVRIRTAELRESEEKFRVLADTTPAAIVVYQDDRFVYLNPAAIQATGYSEDECMNMRFWDMATDDFKTLMRERGMARQRGEDLPPRYEYKWVTKSGEEQWAYLSGARFEYRGKPAGIATLIDITDRKRMEESLRASEEKFRVLAETSPSGICLYQGERIVYVNPATTRLFGYSEQECLQMRFWDWVHQEAREMVRERGLARQRGETVPARYECRYVTKYGEERWMFVSAGRIEYLGEPAGIVTYVDITDRKRMEEELQNARSQLEKRVRERTEELARTTEALRASEKEKSLILNIADAHVLYYDLDMNILWANRAAADSVNLTPGELQRRHCWQVWHQRNEPCERCPVLAARDTGQPQEAEVCTPDGRIWFIRAYPLKDETGRLLGMVEFTQDFTERKQMEEDLRQANLVVENSPVVLFRWRADDAWNVELVSENITQFGYAPETFLSGTISYSAIILPEDLERVKREVRDYCDTGAEQFCLEYRIHTRGGDVRWVNEHTNVERNAEGDVANFEGIVIDITQRKLAEEGLECQKRRLQELNSTLEKRVGEEVAKNREKDILLIQQNRQAAMGELLEHIAHQWKQPLTVVSLLIQNLWFSFTNSELTADTIRETIHATTDLLEHMGQTIEDFRDFYRPDKVKTAFRIRDSVDNALAFVSPALKHEAIAVEVDVDAALMGTGFPREYIQVLLNVLSNARDALRERKTENPTIRIRGFAEENRAVLTITDNAGGIPETLIRSIFDLYVTTKEAAGGTGIGLHMSKNIIEKNMNGSLTAHNIDSGAQFRIAVNQPGGEVA